MRGPKEYSQQFSSEVSFRLKLSDGPNFAATRLARNFQAHILLCFWNSFVLNTWLIVLSAPLKF